jgi:hypothetical protein
MATNQFSIEQAKADGWKVWIKPEGAKDWYAVEYLNVIMGREGVVSYGIFTDGVTFHVPPNEIRNLPHSVDCFCAECVAALQAAGRDGGCEQPDAEVERPAADEHVVAVQVVNTTAGGAVCCAHADESMFDSGDPDWQCDSLCPVPRTELRFLAGKLVAVKYPGGEWVEVANRLQVLNLLDERDRTIADDEHVVAVQVERLDGDVRVYWQKPGTVSFPPDSGFWTLQGGDTMLIPRFELRFLAGKLVAVKYPGGEWIRLDDRQLIDEAQMHADSAIGEMKAAQRDLSNLRVSHRVLTEEHNRVLGELATGLRYLSQCDESWREAEDALTAARAEVEREKKRADGLDGHLNRVCAEVERLQTANRGLLGENDRLAHDSDSQRQQMREAYEQLARLKREVLNHVAIGEHLAALCTGQPEPDDAEAGEFKPDLTCTECGNTLEAIPIKVEDDPVEEWQVPPCERCSKQLADLRELWERARKKVMVEVDELRRLVENDESADDLLYQIDKRLRPALPDAVAALDREDTDG